VPAWERVSEHPLAARDRYRRKERDLKLSEPSEFVNEVGKVFTAPWTAEKSQWATAPSWCK